MKVHLSLVLLFASLFLESPAQNVTAYKPHLLRFEENYNMLPDTVREKSLRLHLKNLRFSSNEKVRVSFGLDYREMFEMVKSYETGGVQDGYWLTRFMTHADIQFGKRWRTFFQLGRGIVAEKSLRLAPVDEDRLFLLNGFVDYRFGAEKTNYLRVGRQELFFGMGRLIAPREGPNIRNTYDAAKVHAQYRNTQVDAFYAYIVNNKPGIFDNEVLGNNQRLWGVYAGKKNAKVNADLYYLGFYNPSASYIKQPQRAKEMRHSIGSRFYGSLLNAIDYDAEIIYQFGSFGNWSINAFEVDGKLFKDILMKRMVLRPAVKFGYASGTRSSKSDQVNTFNPLFPNLLYYQTAIGIFPANIINPNASLTWSMGQASVVGGIDYFWRASEEDGLYAPFGNLRLDVGTGNYLGYQLYTKADYSFTNNLSATFLISRYYKSELVKQNSDSRGIDLLLNILLNFKL